MQILITINSYFRYFAGHLQWYVTGRDRNGVWSVMWVSTITFLTFSVCFCTGNISCQGSTNHSNCEGSLRLEALMIPMTQLFCLTPTMMLDLCVTNCHFLHRAAVFITVVAIVQLLLKAFQLFSLRGHYFYHLSHWLEPLPALGSIVFASISKTPCLCIPSWQWQIGVVTVFVGWISLLFYFRRLPVTGIYVVTFYIA